MWIVICHFASKFIWILPRWIVPHTIHKEDVCGGIEHNSSYIFPRPGVDKSLSRIVSRMHDENLGAWRMHLQCLLRDEENGGREQSGFLFRDSMTAAPVRAAPVWALLSSWSSSTAPCCPSPVFSSSIIAAAPCLVYYIQRYWLVSLEYSKWCIVSSVRYDNDAVLVLSLGRAGDIGAGGDSLDSNHGNFTRVPCLVMSLMKAIF